MPNESIFESIQWQQNNFNSTECNICLRHSNEYYSIVMASNQKLMRIRDCEANLRKWLLINITRNSAEYAAQRAKQQTIYHQRLPENNVPFLDGSPVKSTINCVVEDEEMNLLLQPNFSMQINLDNQLTNEINNVIEDHKEIFTMPESFHLFSTTPRSSRLGGVPGTTSDICDNNIPDRSIINGYMEHSMNNTTNNNFMIRNSSKRHRTDEVNFNDGHSNTKFVNQTIEKLDCDINIDKKKTSNTSSYLNSLAMDFEVNSEYSPILNSFTINSIIT